MLGVRMYLGVAVWLISISCSSQERSTNDPCVITLPKKLREVSGITVVNDSTWAAVQDEEGKVYHINPLTGNVTKAFEFEEEGDFEDLAYVDGVYWVLLSNGTLYRCVFKGEEPAVRKVPTKLSSRNDCEGLCYDRPANRLLIACKGDASLSEKSKGKKRAVYAFDLHTLTLQEEPVMKIKHDELEPFVKNTDFAPSAIAPTQDGTGFWLLSSVGSKLVRVSRSGKVEAVYKLNSSDHKQPEGLVFSDGKWWISNEGRGGDALIRCWEP